MKRIILLTMIFFLFAHQVIAEELFYEDWEDGKVDICPNTDCVWKDVNVGGENAEVINSPVRAGFHALKIDVNYDDPWNGNPSGELNLVKNPVSVFNMGQEYWYRFSLYVPDDFVSSDPGSTIFMQFFPTPDNPPAESWDRHPVLGLSISKDYFTCGIRADSNPITIKGNYDVQRFEKLGPIIRGSWIDFEIYVNWQHTSGNGGAVVISMNGVEVLNYDGPVGYNDKTGPTLKIGPYEWYWRTGKNNVQNRTLYFDEIYIDNTAYDYESSLLADWRFEQNGLDETANCNDLAANNSPNYVRNEIGEYSVDFKADDSPVKYFSHSGEFTNSISQFSIVAHNVKLKSLGRYNALIGRWDSKAGERNFKVTISDKGRIFVSGGYNGGISYENYIHESQLSLNTIYHILVHFDPANNVGRIFVRDENGNTVGTDYSNTMFMQGKTWNKTEGLLTVGCSLENTFPTDAFEGEVGEIKIYSELIPLADFEADLPNP